MKTKINIKKYQKKIKISIKREMFEIAGPLGTLEFKFKDVGFPINLKHSFFLPKRYLLFFINKIKSMFRSVSVGWVKELFFKGIGYKCFKMEDKIALDLGYSNLILYQTSSLIRIRNLKNKLVLFSLNRDHLSNVITVLQKYAVPDKYKGKGIWLKNELFKVKKVSKK